MDSDDLYSFVTNFYSFFIDPLIHILKDTELLGYPLFNWVFGLSILSLGVKFFRRLFNASDDEG